MHPIPQNLLQFHSFVFISVNNPGTSVPSARQCSAHLVSYVIYIDVV